MRFAWRNSLFRCWEKEAIDRPNIELWSRNWIGSCQGTNGNKMVVLSIIATSSCAAQWQPSCLLGYPVSKAGKKWHFLKLCYFLNRLL